MPTPARTVPYDDLILDLWCRNTIVRTIMLRVQVEAKRRGKNLVLNKNDIHNAIDRARRRGDPRAIKRQLFANTIRASA